MQAVIHIGYHRTGSTFLQEQVFPALPVNHVIKPHVPYLIDADPYDPGVLDAQLRREFTIRPDRPTVISHEGLSGLPEGGTEARRERVARRLQQTYPDAKILVIVRDQLQYLLSIYGYRVLLRGMESRSLVQYVDSHYESLIGALQYDALVARYRALFGADRVLALPFELLARDPRAFVAAVAELVGVAPPDGVAARRVNESTRSELVVAINRALNLPLDRTIGAMRRRGWLDHDQYLGLVRPYFVLKERAINPALRRVLADRGRPLALPPALIERLRPVIAASNRRLSQLIGADLRELGYML